MADDGKRKTCGITLWGPRGFPDIKLCGKPAVGMWERTPVCEGHLAQHPGASRGFEGEQERRNAE